MDFTEPNDKTIEPVGVIVTERYATAREALAELLRYDGWRAFEADEATALFTINNNPDAAVLLLDLDMANWKTILNYARTRIPAIFVVGMRGTEPVPLKPELEHCGVAVSFTKPLNYGVVAQAITERQAIAFSVPSKFSQR